jgi:hypothetical protein
MFYESEVVGRGLRLDPLTLLSKTATLLFEMTERDIGILNFSLETMQVVRWQLQLCFL